MIFVLLSSNTKNNQYCMAKLVTNVGLYLRAGDPISELLIIIALFVILDGAASCLRLNNFSYCPSRSELPIFYRYYLPRLIFLTFSGATEGEAPSISATFIILRTLRYFLREGSGLLICSSTRGDSSTPPNCFLPTPQKMLLSPPRGKLNLSA